MNNFTGFSHGINLGGWLSQCCHTNSHYDTFISEEDIRTISSWGLDHIRIPFDYNLLEDETGNPILKGYEYLDNCIAWCKASGLNVILDLHKAAGYNFDDAYKQSNNLFDDENLQNRFITLWSRIAKRYGTLSDFVAFELLNEVVESVNSEPWNLLISRTISEIRTYAPTTYILVGGIQWNSCRTVSLLDPPADSYVVYNFHFYEPLLFTHQKAHWVEELANDVTIYYPATMAAYKEHSAPLLEKGSLVMEQTSDEMDIAFIRNLILDAVEAAKRYNAPLYCGEYGVIELAPTASTISWYKDISAVFDEFNIGRCAWTYKALDFDLINAHHGQILEKLIPLF